METKSRSAALLAAIAGLGSLPRSLLGSLTSDKADPVMPDDALAAALKHAAHPIGFKGMSKRRKRYNRLRAHSRRNPYIADAQFDSSGHAKRLAPATGTGTAAFGGKYISYATHDKRTRIRLNPHLPEAEVK